MVGDKGAGTIFFSGCNLRCVFCQNWQISQKNLGKDYSPQEFKKIMMDLQERGASNIDLVSPTIWAERIRQSISEARKEGLTIPVVWNSNAYESKDMLKKFEGLVDIYLPDFKYGDNDAAFKYSGVKNYAEKARESIEEMLRQVGSQKVIVRHLILPNNIENSKKALKFIKELGPEIRVSLISQYEPTYKAKNFPEINRNINKEESEEVFNCLTELGLEHGWVQEMGSHNKFLPDFTRENPFN